MGFDHEQLLYFANAPVSMIGRVDESLYAMMTQILLDGTKYMATFDFDDTRWEELLTLLPPDLIGDLAEAFIDYPAAVEEIKSPRPRVSIRARLGDRVLQNEDEAYLLII